MYTGYILTPVQCIIGVDGLDKWKNKHFNNVELWHKYHFCLYILHFVHFANLLKPLAEQKTHVKQGGAATWYIW